MVMRPEPWGEALDAIVPDAPRTPRLIVPTPAGALFNQSSPEISPVEEHLIFACGRYEGIDERVLDHARTRVEVSEISIGDYVLFGGEVAALVILEAVIRLRPGVLGNADSLIEESHADGLLEAPLYTKPAVWRGLAVPEVLPLGRPCPDRPVAAGAGPAPADAARSRARRTCSRTDLISGGGVPYRIWHSSGVAAPVVGR